MNQILSFLFIATLVILCGCRQDDLVDDPDTPELLDLADWTEETHGSLTDPDYTVVFNQDEVLRFDIEISSDDWATMQSDLASNLSSGGGRVDDLVAEDRVKLPNLTRSGSPALFISMIPNGIRWASGTRAIQVYPRPTRWDWPNSP